MIVPKHYENINVLHENTMPNRSYYIPASKIMHTLVNNRKESARFQLLKFAGYDGSAVVQAESCISMLKTMYLIIPVVITVIITFIMSRMKVEKANEELRVKKNYSTV